MTTLKANAGSDIRETECYRLLVIRKYQSNYIAPGAIQYSGLEPCTGNTLVKKIEQMVPDQQRHD